MKRVYCSRDSVSGSWTEPQVFFSDSEAKRSFCWGIAASGCPDGLVKDLDLYHIGTFDETNGHLNSVEPIHICNGLDKLTYFYRDYITKSQEVVDNEISQET